MRVAEPTVERLIQYYRLLKQMKDNITGEGKTSAGLLSFVEKIFHS